MKIRRNKSLNARVSFLLGKGVFAGVGWRCPKNPHIYP
jgi:hypothetical protein